MSGGAWVANIRTSIPNPGEHVAVLRKREKSHWMWLQGTGFGSTSGRSRKAHLRVPGVVRPRRGSLTDSERPITAEAEARLWRTLSARGCLIGSHSSGGG